MEVACKTSALLQPPPRTPIRNEATPNQSYLVLRSCPKAPHASWLTSASLRLLQDKHPSISPSLGSSFPDRAIHRAFRVGYRDGHPCSTKEERVSNYAPCPPYLYPAQCGGVVVWGMGDLLCALCLRLPGGGGRLSISEKVCNGINGRRCFR